MSHHEDASERSKPSIAIGLLAAVTVLLVIGTIVVFVMSRSDPFAQAVRDLQARGEPTTLLDLAPEPDRATRENAAELVASAAISANAILQELGDLTQASVEPARIDQAFADHPDILTQIERATEAEVYMLELNYNAGIDEMMEQLMSVCRRPLGCMRILDLQLTRLLNAGQHDQAFATVEQAFVLARFSEKHPFMISYLVALAAKSIAIEMADRLVMSEAMLTEAQHDRLESLLVAADTAAWHRQALQSERVMTLERMKEPPMWFVRRREGAALLAAYEEQFARVAEESLSGGQVKRRSEAEAGQPSRRAESQLVTLMEPAFKQCRQGRVDLRRALRRARIRNELKRAGRRPESWTERDLTELALPAVAMTDPVTGEWLRPAD